MKIEKIDHICFAVKNLDEAVKVYEETLGLKPALTYTVESEKIKVVRYYVGDVGVELMESTSPDGEVAKHIRKRGEGFFLISYKVDDVAKSLDELREKGKNTLYLNLDYEPDLRYVATHEALSGSRSRLRNLLPEVSVHKRQSSDGIKVYL